MKINAKDTILDTPILTIRKFLKNTSRGEIWSESLACQLLKLDVDETRRLLDELSRLGYIEQASSRNGQQRWQNTIQGNALALASAAKPTTRAKADQIFADFMQRVHTVNNDPYYLFKVTKVVLFGSYLQDTPTVNDIDLAIDMDCKEPDIKRRGELFKQRRKESGRNFGSYIDYVGWPETEVWMFLKSRSRVLSLHPFTLEAAFLSTVENKVVFAENLLF